jgi:hypothetical protein
MLVWAGPTPVLSGWSSHQSVGPSHTPGSTTTWCRRAEPCRCRRAWVTKARVHRAACAGLWPTLTANGIFVAAALSRSTVQPSPVPALACLRLRVAALRPVRVPGPHPGSWAVVSRSGPSARPVTVAPTTPAFAKARMRPWPTASRSRTCHGPIGLARVSGQIGPGSRSPCRLAAPRWPKPWRTCGALPHPRHARRITTQQAGQGLDALHPEPRRHAVAQDVLDDGHHLAVAGGTVGLRQPHQHTAGRQERTEGIQPRAGIEPIDPIHQVLPGQTACPSGIVAPGDLPPPPLRQGLRDLVGRWPQGPPAALVGLPAREARGPSLKVLAYVGTSAHTSGWYTTDLLGNPIGGNQQRFRYAVDMGVDVHVKLLCRWMASISFTDSVPE